MTAKEYKEYAAKDYSKIKDLITSDGKHNPKSEITSRQKIFKTKWLEYENIERVAGETKWNFFKLLLYSFEGITAFSTVPLAISSVAGIVLCIIAFLALIFIVVRTLIWGDPVAGWPSLACIIVFTSGVQLLCVGILGQYLSKTYLEVKGRPVYIIKEKN